MQPATDNSEVVMVAQRIGDPTAPALQLSVADNVDGEKAEESQSKRGRSSPTRSQKRPAIENSPGVRTGRGKGPGKQSLWIPSNTDLSSSPPKRQVDDPNAALEHLQEQMGTDRQRLKEALDKIDQVNLTQQNQMAINLEYNKKHEKYQELIEEMSVRMRMLEATGATNVTNDQPRQEIDALKTRMTQVEG